METDPASARAALDAVHETQQVNAERLRRPRGYWVFFGLMLATLPLVRYLTFLPEVLRYTLPAVIAVGIALIASRTQPNAVRNIRLPVASWLQLVGFAVLIGIIGGAAGALHAAEDWWWAPLAGAALLFGAAVVGGPILDRAWTRRAIGATR